MTNDTCPEIGLLADHHLRAEIIAANPAALGDLDLLVAIATTFFQVCLDLPAACFKQLPRIGGVQSRLHRVSGQFLDLGAMHPSRGKPKALFRLADFFLRR